MHMMFWAQATAPGKHRVCNMQSQDPFFRGKKHYSFELRQHKIAQQKSKQLTIKHFYIKF